MQHLVEMINSTNTKDDVTDENDFKEHDDDHRSHKNNLVFSQIDSFTNENVQLAVYTKLSAIRAIGLCFEIRY